MSHKLFGVVATLLLAYASVPSGAQEVRKLQDNSFLLEEAYNQEDGVIQHIQAFQYLQGGDWAYTFTQEWPVPTQKHQFSYTIPYLQLNDDGQSRTGFADVLLNYRYQAVLKGPVAFAPRVSLIAPTGDRKKGLGTDAWGVQGNLPLSLELGDRWVTHWNLGATLLPGATSPDGAQADLTWINYGASVIYLVDDHFNLMLEAAGWTNDRFSDGGKVEKEHLFFLNPGMRYAIDVDSGLQIVPGLSFPIGIGPSAGEFGVFLYLSFEHPLFKAKGSSR
jgi:hypothetical protein